MGFVRKFTSMASMCKFCVFLVLVTFPRIYDCVDPEAFMNATSLITYNGFPVENHYAKTIDGFTLNMQRIPHGRMSTDTRGVVLLQHGLTGSSDCFLFNLINGSLGFILAETGYDVWLSNVRGNPYSLMNDKYSPSQEEFWNWSWQEHAGYDLPAVINHVLNVTGQEKLFYIGHSQGTKMGFAQFSVDKSLADKVKLFIALAPVAKVTNVGGILGFLAPLVTPETAYLLLGRKYYDQNSSFTEWIATNVCDTLPGQYLCNGFSSLIMGFNTKNMNLSREAVYQAHANQASSVKNLVHYIQEIKADKFQKYDYGSPAENMKYYNQTTPPEYTAKNMTVPVALYFGDNDFLSDRTDVQYLLDNLPNIVHQKEYETYAHMDFLLGKDAPTILYPDILQILKQYK